MTREIQTSTKILSKKHIIVYKFRPATKAISFFVGIVTRGKPLEENYKSLGVHVC